MVTALLLWSLALVSLLLVLATLPALLLQRFVRVTPDELEESWVGRFGDPTQGLLDAEAVLARALRLGQMK